MKTPNGHCDDIAHWAKGKLCRNDDDGISIGQHRARSLLLTGRKEHACQQQNVDARALSGKGGAGRRGDHLCASNTEALVPKAGPYRQEPKRPLSLFAHLLCAIPAVMASAKGHLLRRHPPHMAPAQTQASWKEVA